MEDGFKTWLRQNSLLFSMIVPVPILIPLWIRSETVQWHSALESVQNFLCLKTFDTFCGEHTYATQVYMYDIYVYIFIYIRCISNYVFWACSGELVQRSSAGLVIRI